MEARQFQGLILGFIVGIALFAFFYYESQNLLCLILIPIGAVMGMAPQLLKPKDMDDDE
ncbi:hypothetical protein [Candidatus Methanoprimaticola sp. MG2]|uniref:hypothetical protein n=1 Tax=Candidatus Methanoprimaticola sp. MG2 TaxID=3228838 RepID=UPI0039C746AB